jgi:hypothetical protein
MNEEPRAQPVEQEEEEEEEEEERQLAASGPGQGRGRRPPTMDELETAALPETCSGGKSWSVWWPR